MNLPDNIKYTKDHEWIRVENQFGWIGITDYAQGELGDIVYVETPAVGKRIEQGKSFGTIEAVKAVSDLFAPVSGEVIEVNVEIQTHPEVINKDPYGKGWIVKISITDFNQLNSLLDVQKYKAIVTK
jgi:glycine cleavage system H protein